MRRGVCPKCNSRVIIKKQPILEMGHYNVPYNLSIRISKKRKEGWLPLPPSLIFGQITAWICGQCGYTELYTENFKELLEADRESGKSKDNRRNNT